MSSTTTPATIAKRKDIRRNFRKLIWVGRGLYENKPPEALTPDKKFEWFMALWDIVEKVEKAMPTLPDKAGLESRIAECQSWKRHLLDVVDDIFLGVNQSTDSFSSVSSVEQPSEEDASADEGEGNSSEPVRAGQKRSFAAEDAQAKGKGMADDKAVGGPVKKAKAAASSSTSEGSELSDSDDSDSDIDKAEVRHIRELRQQEKTAEEAFDGAMARLEHTTHEFLLTKREYTAAADEVTRAVEAYLEAGFQQALALARSAPYE
ncbi:hypothetical protein BD410DRAFT_846525 [Rickenella mellea]|uniref:Uncharacterized protein n=1 Tax=Rickenella mellea TaxID=50990 RepID=A0A4Y7PF09_9AGAM|nr:hypothetical protein BD410DRAFT_846525 [Rickenella mellea]